MKRYRYFIAVLLAAIGLWPNATFARDDATRSPFGIAVTATNDAAGGKLLRVNFTVPPQCVLYFDRLHFCTSSGAAVKPVTMPEPIVETDLVTGKPRKVYLNDFSATINPADIPDHTLAVKFQGCTNAACFFPEQRRFAMTADGSMPEVTSDNSRTNAIAGRDDNSTDWAQQFKGFTVQGQQTGYLGPQDFSAFLDQSLAGKGNANALAKFQNMGLLAVLLLIVAGGFLLNFTPCVLPMIPINLAIIGAGKKARSRMDGFRNGSIYGLGMALAYGTLGLFVVLTGSKFGTLNSSTWFNAVIALVFILLALGMFDVVNIDLSRFGGTSRTATAAKGTLAQNALVLSLGVMSALLAGACVAPVVISVILLATNFYAKGVMAGLLLPFLLGIGMALPWPFAGAGLTFLPKPGKWMKYVKQGFGVMILAFAVYYGHLAWHAYQSFRPQVAAARGAADSAAAPDQTDRELMAALQESRTTGRPLFIDFHASWCKDCSAMDATVFNRSDVKSRLQQFIVVRYAAEQPNNAPAKPLLDHFSIVGLPAYLVLSSK